MRELIDNLHVGTRADSAGEKLGDTQGDDFIVSAAEMDLRNMRHLSGNIDWVQRLRHQRDLMPTIDSVVIEVAGDRAQRGNILTLRRDQYCDRGSAGIAS